MLYSSSRMERGAEKREKYTKLTFKKKHKKISKKSYDDTCNTFEPIYKSEDRSHQIGFF